MYKTRDKNLFYTFAALICLLLTSLPAKAKETIDPGILQLVNKVIAHPELMNINYLQYIIGFPENGRTQTGLLRRNYHWYSEPGRFLTYSLEQQGPHPHVVTNSTLAINVKGSNIRMKDVEQVFGQLYSTTFDHQSNPNRIYRVSPTTFLVVVQPRHEYRVKQFRVVYAGPALGPPSQQDMDLAYNFRKGEALLAGQSGEWHKAIPWLRADVAKEPSNPEARMKLAFAYRQHLMINEAIREYVEALKLSGNRPELTSAAIAALTEMRVWPVQKLPPQQRTFIAGTNTNPSL